MNTVAKNVLGLAATFAAAAGGTNTLPPVVSTSTSTPQSVTPFRAGEGRARLREAHRAVQIAELYAETPIHPPTRQRQRWLEKPWRQWR